MRINEAVVNNLREELINRNASVRFMHVLIGIAESLASDPETLTLCLDRDIDLCEGQKFKAVLNKFSTGKIDARGYNKCFAADIELAGAKVGEAIWDDISMVESCDEVAAFFTIVGVKELYSIAAPNPGTNNQDDYNWCMMTLVELTVLGLTGGVDNGKEA